MKDLTTLSPQKPVEGNQAKASQNQFDIFSSGFSLKVSFVEEELQNAARHGVNTSRFGLLTTSYSDHLPIKTTFQEKGIMSWNMLADVHLKNQLMAVSGYKLIVEVIKKYRKELEEEDLLSKHKNDYFKNMHVFLAEFAQFALSTKSRENEVIIDVQLINRFINSDPSKAIARKEIVNLFNNQPTAIRQEWLLAVVHACQMYEQISNTLKWDKRYEHLAQDSELISEFRSRDFICLQECSKPKDILDSINAADLKASKQPTYGMITHKVRGDDHCVIIYNVQKYKPVGEPVKFALGKGEEKNKPCILCKFEKIDTTPDKPEQFIIGSIHHPGGDRQLQLTDIFEHEQTLQNTERTVPYCICGDYNNTADTLKRGLKSVSSSTAHFHTACSFGGTMAGQDYGNANKAIDGVLSSQEQMEVSVVTQKVANPVESQMRVRLS
ncbi:endonuclease/exonuclease/phosphatase family protein [Legionella waltersii]|nr:endonuclease/exonuclease/phosphatase family protein [Legionella waltersii]